MIWKLALRHLSRNWWLNLVLLVVMVLGAALLASLPMLATTIAGESLSKSLENAPVHVRNIVVLGKSRTDELPEEVGIALGNIMGETITVREAEVIGFPIIYKPDATQINLYPATLIMNLRSFDRLEERVRVLEGRLPESKPVIERGEEAPIFEAAIGAEAARRMGISLEDRISPAGGSYHLRIVGIVKPLHPNSEVWWGDSQMMPFSIQYQ